MAITEDARVWLEERERFVAPYELGCTSVGSSPVVVIETQGPSLRISPDVFVLTDRGELPASKLRRGDHVEYLQRPPVTVNRDAQKVRLGEIVGYITGVGTMYKHQAVVTPLHQHGVQPISNDVLRLQETLRAIAPPRPGSSDTYDARRLFDMLAGVGIDDNVKFAIPAWVERGSLEVILGFVRGVFSACAKTKRTVVLRGREPRWNVRTEEYDEPDEDYEEGEVHELWITLPTIYDSKRSYSTRILLDLQLLLLKLGVVSRLLKSHGPLVVAPESLDNFESTIGCIDPLKASAIKALPRATFKRHNYLRVERTSRPRAAVEILGFPEPVTCFVNGLLIQAPHCQPQRSG